MSLTTDRNSECLNVPKDNGQNECYLILSDEERAKGFIRPVRTSYIHRGREVETEGKIISLKKKLKNASDFDKEHYSEANGYAGFLKYPKSRSPLVGKYLTKKELDAIESKEKYVGGCGCLTRMNITISETYARDPNFYGSTFCVGCGTHLPLNQFVWDGTDELVGS